MIDELVAEDSERRFLDRSSGSVNEDAFVDGSSETCVMKVGEVVLDDCVIFGSSSMLESWSWLATDERLALEGRSPVVDSTSFAVCVFDVGENATAEDLWAKSIFRFRS